MNQAKKDQFVRDVFFVAVSICVAVYALKNGYVEAILSALGGYAILGSFFAGMFYVSIFTTAPAAVFLLELSNNNPLWLVALAAGLGGLIGDLLIFKFMEDNLSEDIKWLLSKTGHKRVFYIFKRKMFRWFVPFIGAILVASPLPDELGLALMGFSKLKLRAFIPLSFILDFASVYILVYLVEVIAK
jgi:hypothetical protein